MTDIVEQSSEPFVIDERHRPDVREVEAPDESAKAVVYRRGAQVWRVIIGRFDILFPRTKPFSVATDTREGGNPPEIGETSGPGGTFPSFGGDIVLEVDGTSHGSIVHGPFGQAYTLYHVKDNAGYVDMDVRPPGDSDAFFKQGERYALRRRVETQDGGKVVIKNDIRNKSGKPVDPPEFVEHAYLDGGKGACILKGDGKFLFPEALPRVYAENGNIIDARLQTDETGTGTPGKIVFLPKGPDGHVVVISAKITEPDGSERPVPQFCIYRHLEEDPWTGVEPSACGSHLEDNEAFTLTTTFAVYESLDAYKAAIHQA